MLLTFADLFMGVAIQEATAGSVHPILVPVTGSTGYADPRFFIYQAVHV